MGHDLTLLSSIAPPREVDSPNGLRVTRVRLSGDPHAAAIVDAVKADYSRVTGRPPVTDAQLQELVGQQVSLLRTGTNLVGAGAIVASPGTVFQGAQLGLLPRGARRHGYRISGRTTLDLEPGYGGMEALAKRVQAVRATLPQVSELTQERLAQLPSRGRDCTLAVFGTWRLPDTTAAGAIWLLHSYLSGDDIAEGVLLVRPEDAISEHGSVFGQQLLRVGGEIVDAPVISLREALELTFTDYDEVLARFVGKC